MLSFSLSKVVGLLEKANDHGVNISFSDNELSVHVQKGKQIDKFFLDELRINKPLLIHYFENFANKESKADVPPIQKIDRNEVKRIPLSFAQERLWFIHKLDGSVQYHIPTVLRLKGKLNREALEHALQNIINRHEVLRTVILEDEEGGYQHVKEQSNWQLNIVDNVSFEEGSEELLQYIRQLIKQPFDLSADYMFRACLISMGDDEHMLVATMHHIAADGWSTAIIVKELLELYAAFEENRPAQLTLLSIQYADYAIWQRKYLQGEILEEKIAYWKKKLADVTTLQLATDYPRPAVQSNRGARIVFNIEKDLTEKLFSLSQEQGCTLFMTLLTAYNVLLHRYSGQSDICVGTPMVNRTQKELESLIGFFINTLALRNDLAGNPSFIGLLQQLKANTLEAYDHQELPFEKVVESVIKERDISRNPLFQVLFTMRNTPRVPEIRLGNIELSQQEMEHTTSQLDIICNIMESPEGLNGSIIYCKDLFTEQTMLQMMRHFKELLRSIVKRPEQKIGELAMLSAEDRQQLLLDFNDTYVESDNRSTIVDLFEAQVTKSPNSPALIFEEQQLTFHELNERSNQLAAFLKLKGVKAESLVPLCLEPGIDMIVGILGILKSGAAYVPIDPGNPLKRINYLLKDMKASILLTSTESSSNLSGEFNVEMILIDGDWPLISSQPTSNPPSIIQPEQLAYVIYTSGSTGNPKGVLVEHRNIINYLLNEKTRYIRTESDNSGSFMYLSYTFDASLTAIFMPLLSGKSLVIGSKESVDVFEDANFHKYAPYDFIKLTPAHLALLQPKIKTSGGVPVTRRIVLGGEALLPNQLNYMVEDGLDVEIINEYGPTEATVGCTVFSFQTVKDIGSLKNGIPIGKPIHNVQIHILGNYNELLPFGAIGEIGISGAGVARGYLNRPELTAEKFIKDPFPVRGTVSSSEPIIYKTGDLGRWLPDGNIEYLGRKDDQVKIRGFRVELGEIERVLLQSGLVDQCAVLALEDSSGSKRLVGYVVCGDGFEKEEAMDYIRALLPEYMIPLQWVVMESFPLTSNGKLDRKSLPDPDASELLAGQYVAPRNDTEKRLVDIWKEILEEEVIGINDNFFELGGHSLLSVRMISAIRKAFSIEIPISDIFDYPTVAQLARQLLKQSSKALQPAIMAVTPRPEYIPLSFSQERLWFIDQLEGSIQYHITATLRLKGQLNKNALSHSLQQIVNRHEVLRTVIVEDESGVYQSIKERDQWQLNSIDEKAFNNNGEFRQHINQLIKRPFNFKEDHMLRADLIALNEDEHVLVITIHHIASDGWSASIIVHELLEFWKAFEEGREAFLPKLPLQYADFAIWQRNFLQGEVLEKKMAYWKENLQGVAPLELPTDFVRPLMQSKRGAFARFTLDNDISAELQRLSRKEGTSLFMTLLAIFKVLLFRYTGQHDICVGTPIAGRQQQELEKLIGFFVNTLALRTEMNELISFRELLQQIRSNTLKAYENQEVPFEKVVEAVVKERELSRSPLFQVMFVLQNTPPVEDLRLGDLELVREDKEHDTAKFDLMFSISETPQGLNGAVEYCPDLFNEQTIQRMIGHFKALLKAVVNAPEEKIGMLPMLSSEEKHQLLGEFNDTAIPYPKEKSIAHLFEEQVIKAPGSTAVVFEKDEINYNQLNERSNQLAHYLRSKGVSENMLVPICIERSIEMIVGVIAILKAGAAYVPIDPDYPSDRIAYMIEDLQARLVISSKASKAHISSYGNCQVLDIISAWNEVEQYPKTNPGTAYLPDQLAYMLYTSGSTGRPKGVKMPGGALVNLLMWQESQFETRNRRVIQFASLNFDVSFQEIFSTLCFGSALYLIKAERRMDMAELLNDLVEHKITHLFAPYIVLKNLSEQVLSVPGISFWLDEVISAGEQLKITPDIELMLKKHVGKITNQYGPTEAHVVSSFKMHSADVFPTIPPIGKPIDNTRLYILDNSRQLVPVGVAGEIYIGGVQVAQGYLNQPEQTGEKFIKGFFSHDEDATLYRTGDIARWHTDGNIEYLGRVDDQVKIRGYRIELGEIESVLMECNHVHQAVVMARDDVNNNKRLVSYIVPEREFRREEIIAHAKSNLPDYMVPSLWVEMEKLPVNRNGKVDKKLLPNPDASELVGNQFIAPGNNLEISLAEIWMKLLGVGRVGINDNFFELGGHSLLATRVVSAIRQELKVEITIKDLFVYPTVAELALQIKEKNDVILSPAIVLQERPKFIPLSFSQERLWFIHKLEGSLHYHMPVVLRLRGNLNIEALEFSLRSIVQRHEVLRTVFLEDHGQPYQFILNSEEWILNKENLTGYQGNKSSLQNYLKVFLNKPFDLAKDYMFRADLFTVDDEEFLLAVNTHHIAMDGWSISILVGELVEMYNAVSQNRSPALDPLPVQYADFAIWQRSHMDSELLSKKLSYWKQKLEGTTPLQFPSDYPRPALQSVKGASKSFIIDQDLNAKLHELSNQHGATLFMTLLAAFKVLLFRYSGQSDICVGTPIAGRLQKEVEGLVGLFINTLAIRTGIDPRVSFNTLLNQIKTTTLEAYENQEVPFEKVVDMVVIERDLSRNPLFQVMLILQNTPERPVLKLGEVELSAEENSQTVSKFDMTFLITESEGKLYGSVQYCTELFLPATMEKIITHFLELLRSVVNQPSQKIGLLPMLSSIEEQRLLVEFNDTSTPYPLYKSLVTLFEEQVENNPGNTALIFENEIYTYSELNQQANQLAHFLRKKGVNGKSVVPLCIERSTNMVVGLLGILKTGACYVPVDPEYPIDRVVYMIRDSGAEIVVSNKAAQQKLTGIAGLTILSFDEEGVAIAKESKENLNVQIGADDLAYVIYTSGSTGKPKGVMVENRGLVNLLFSVRDSVDFNSFSSFLSVTTFSFDISYLELFLPLVTGGKLFLVPREIAIDGFRLASMLSNYRPTHMQATPFTWLLLLDTNWKNEENITMLIGGEAVKEDVKEKLTALGDLYNMYGPTETTIWSVMKKLTAQQKVLIGKPIANTSIYILSKDLRLVPTGVSGEICIAGAGLARGYFNLPELTDEKFISNPFSNLPGEKLYKTGDLGRWTADGNIECLGRLDEQVKIRGYRIELGEIETSILHSDLVTQAAVLVKEDGENNSRLIAYFIPAMKSLKEKERSLYESQVIGWREIYEAEYAVRNENMETEFDINIWKSSFNGELINSHHMQEWVDDIVTEVLSESPENVLEIGTGSGLIFYRLAGHVKKYIGTDFSQSSIDRIVRRIDEAEKNYGEVSFKVCAAHEIVLGEDEKVNTILLNSVVQYFPGEDYMTRVIEKSIILLQNGGRVIIGDVRDNRLLSLFKGRLQLQKLHQSVSLQEYNWWVNQELIKEEELCFSPEYFSMLKTIYPRITEVEIKWKQASYINELSAYRYTVILHIDARKSVLSPDWKTLRNAGGAQLIIRQLENAEPIIALKKIANPRLKEEKLLDKVLKEKTVNNVGEILHSLQAIDEETNEIAKILDLAKLKGYESSLFLDEDPLKINLLLQLRPSDEFIEMPSAEKIPGESSLLTNTPLFNDICFLIQKELRTGLQNSLPDYMVPVDFFGVQEFPLTNNGKVDRKFLSQRQNTGMRSNINYEPPATEIQIKLANIWMELLGIDRVGIFDNFFELGGHSLLAMRIISAIRSQFDVELAIKDLFQFTTIDELSKYLEIQLNVYSKEGDDSEFDLLYI